MKRKKKNFIAEWETRHCTLDPNKNQQGQERSWTQIPKNQILERTLTSAHNIHEHQRATHDDQADDPHHTRYHLRQSKPVPRYDLRQRRQQGVIDTEGKDDGVSVQWVM